MLGIHIPSHNGNSFSWETPRERHTFSTSSVSMSMREALVVKIFADPQLQVTLISTDLTPYLDQSTVDLESEEQPQGEALIRMYPSIAILRVKYVNTPNYHTGSNLPSCSCSRDVFNGIKGRSRQDDLQCEKSLQQRRHYFMHHGFPFDPLCRS